MGKEALEALIGALDNWAAFFTLLVVIGVGGELFVHIKQSRANKQLIALQRTEAIAQETEIERLRKVSASYEFSIATANKGSAEALERAAKAEENLGNASKDAALANERAALAEQHAAEANLELARLKTPRTLNPEQQKRVSDKVKVFAGKQFDIALNVDPETEGLLAPIENALGAAGWVEIDWKGSNNIAELTFTRPNRSAAGLANVSGVIIQMHPEQVPELAAAAQALAFALSAEGISAQAQGGIGIPNINTKAIHVLIGKKP